MTLGIWLFVTITVLPEILFCFGSKIRRNGQETLFWESLYLTQKNHLYESPQGQIQKIQIAVAGKLASYMDSYYFATVIEQIIQKSTEKKDGWRRPLGHPLNLPVVPMGFTILSSRWLFDSIHHLMHVYFESRISTQFFFRSLLPSVPRLNIFPCGF